MVEVDGYWCEECQTAAGRSPDTGKTLALSMIPNLNPVWQATLFNAPESIVRIKLAQRDDLDYRVRRQLLRDPDEMVVRITAAARGNDPARLYGLLFESPSRELLLVLAGQAEMPLRGLRLLCDSDDPEIAERARQTFLEAYERSTVS